MGGARLLLVLSSISPLFILWAIRGVRIIPDTYFVLFCLVMVALPNLFLYIRIKTATRLEDRRELVVGASEDHRDHLLVYLFSMLLPFYAEQMDRWRDVGAVLAALIFIIFLFWHLNLHYMNIVFAVRGYRLFTITSPEDNNPFTGRATVVLITPRNVLSHGDRVLAYRLSDTVYYEPR